MQVGCLSFSLALGLLQAFNHTQVNLYSSFFCFSLLSIFSCFISLSDPITVAHMLMLLFFDPTCICNILRGLWI